MDILLVPTPLFSKEMAVEAHLFRFRYGNDLTIGAKPASFLDGAMNSPLLETLKLVGIEPFAMDKPIFVPISAMVLLGDVARQCPEPFDKIVLLLFPDVSPTEQYVGKIRILRLKGFHFAMMGLNNIDELTNFTPILSECEYLFLDQKSPIAMHNPAELPPEVRRLKLIASGIDTLDLYKKLSMKSFSMFEGPFYRTPITMGNKKVAPLKVNLVRLLNLTQDENFEFNEVATIIERDTALSVSLLQMVNSPSMGLSQKIKSIHQAVAMLGVYEMRKWSATSVSRVLGSDKPDEITKLSLIRAKFAENLASLFNLDKFSQSLFLMGLFSVLDIILDVPMRRALNMVHIDDDIANALINRSGHFYPILRLILLYEQSDWRTVSRYLIVNDITVSNAYDAYIGATLWYKELIADIADNLNGNVLSDKSDSSSGNTDNTAIL